MADAEKRKRPSRALSVLLGAALWHLACGGPQKQGEAGAICFRTDDCAVGFACVPETNGASKRVCSSDLSGIVPKGDAPPGEAAATPTAVASAPEPASGGAESAGRGTGGGAGAAEGLLAGTGG